MPEIPSTRSFSLPEISLSYLIVYFNHLLTHDDLHYFRAAISDIAGRQHVLFHHHVGESGFLYKYPLIQYKIINGLPSIFCIGNGVTEIEKFFNRQPWKIILYKKEVTLQVEQLNSGTHPFAITDTFIPYRISRWLAFKKENYETFRSETDPARSLAMLSRILTGNIITMAKGINWTVPGRILLRLEDNYRTYPVQLKNTPLMAIDARFRCNVNLPDYIGLGKHVSEGNGMVQRLRLRKETAAS